MRARKSTLRGACQRATIPRRNRRSTQKTRVSRAPPEPCRAAALTAPLRYSSSLDLVAVGDWSAHQWAHGNSALAPPRGRNRTVHGGRERQAGGVSVSVAATPSVSSVQSSGGSAGGRCLGAGGAARARRGGNHTQRAAGAPPPPGGRTSWLPHAPAVAGGPAG